jgi:predicted AlkP superfamily phosphohydrolase/phosphomutase
MIEKSKKSLKKVIIVGLDGVPYSLLQHYLDHGLMPKFARIVAQGRLVSMRSSLPEVSSVAWTSFMTGKNPGEHGVFGFMEIDQSSYEYYFPNFLSLKTAPFWEELDLSVVALNIPQTYPARPTKGVMVSGFVALDLAQAVYPERVYHYLKELDYRLDVTPQLAVENPRAFFHELLYVLDKRVQAVKHLCISEPWDIFIATITETDRLHHFFFDSSRQGDHFEEFQKIYRKLDDFLSDMFSLAQSNRALFLTCSDHGFTEIKTEVNVNRYLMENDILRLPDGEPLTSISPEAVAFCLDPSRVYIHLCDKYARGRVTAANYQARCREVKSLFEALEFQGQKVVRQVFAKEEIFSGAYAEQAPDLYVLGEPGFDLKANLNKKEIFGKSHFRGTHTYEDAHLFVAPDQIPLDFDVSIEAIPHICRKYFGEM